MFETILLICLFTLTYCQVSTDIFRTYQTGDGTYYGGNIAAGACSLNPVVRFANPTTTFSTAQFNGVALNSPQYGNSEACGMCIKIDGTGSGSGANPIGSNVLAYVTDLCPECNTGAVDLGWNGDGRWGIRWIAVDCPTIGGIEYLFQGSHQWYIKLQARNTKIPVRSIAILKGSSYVAGSRTPDNFFTFNNIYPVSGSLQLKITSISGESVFDTIVSPTYTNLLVNYGANNTQFTGLATTPNPSPTNAPPTNPPPTNAPPTNPPPTNAPPTNPPPTNAPPTNPDPSNLVNTPTNAPPTDAPPTDVPTDAPTDAPPTDAPTDAPTNPPPTNAPATDPPPQAACSSIYKNDQIQSPFQSWSWGTFSLANPTVSLTGTKSLSLTLSNWDAIYLRCYRCISTTNYRGVSFSVYTLGDGPAQFRVQFRDLNDNLTGNFRIVTALPNTWTRYDILFDELTSGSGVTTFNSIQFQDNGATNPQLVYFDAVTLICNLI